MKNVRLHDKVAAASKLGQATTITTPTPVAGEYAVNTGDPTVAASRAEQTVNINF